VKRVSFESVAIGSITDIVGTNVVLLPVIIYVVAAASAGSPPVSNGETTTQILMRSHLFIVSSTILGGLCSVLGGYYVAARIAKYDHLLNGGLSFRSFASRAECTP